MQEACKKLFAHMRWADEQTLAALRNVKEEDWQRPELKLLGERFMHVIAAEHLWIRRIHAEAPNVPVWPPFDIDVCAMVMAKNHKELGDLLARAGTTGLTHEVSYFNTAGKPFKSKIGDIVLHVCMHGAWHRGQVAILMRQAGLQPAPTDYIAFVRGVPAATQKPGGSSPARATPGKTASAPPRKPATPGKAPAAAAPAPRPGPPSPAKTPKPAAPRLPVSKPGTPAPGKPRPPR